MFTLRRLSALGLAVILGLALGAPDTAQAQDRPKILYDRAHGENPPVPGFATIAERLGLDVVVGTTPITSAALAGTRVLYLRAPSTLITPEEKAAVIAFV